MPGPSIVKVGSRIIYKAADGRFTTKANYQAQKNMESYLRRELGAPPSGKSWTQIASKYAERFADYLGIDV